MKYPEKGNIMSNLYEKNRGTRKLEKNINQRIESTAPYPTSSVPKLYREDQKLLFTKQSSD